MRYKSLSRAWRHRVFGRRFSFYFWLIFSLLLLLVVLARPSGRWSLLIGLGFGAAFAGWLLLPEALVPARIFRWQLGAWGEQMTQSELKRLKREGWVVRHDVRWGTRANHDHVIAGPAVYVINSKNLRNSSIEIEGGVVRVTDLDTDDSYVADRWAPIARSEARSLKRELSAELGFPVHVYPVVALWGNFDVEQRYVGEVSFVAGEKIVEWLRSRRADLLTAEKRAAVAQAVHLLPRA